MTRYLTHDWLLMLPENAKALVQEYLMLHNTTLEQYAGGMEAGKALDELGIWVCAKRTGVNVMIHHQQGAWST